jgi:hypothetical protein
MENKQILSVKVFLNLCLDYLNDFRTTQFFVLYPNEKESARNIMIFRWITACPANGDPAWPKLKFKFLKFKDTYFVEHI